MAVIGNLQAYKFKFHTETGSENDIYLVCKGLSVNFDLQTATVFFGGYASEELRNLHSKNPNSGINFWTFNLLLEGAKFQELFMNQTAGEIFGVETSNLIWQEAKNTKFIQDILIDFKTGDITRELKSLDDLEAKQVLLPIEISDELLKELKNA
jgi:hypothetical protein